MESAVKRLGVTLFKLFTLHCYAMLFNDMGEDYFVKSIDTKFVETAVVNFLKNPHSWS